MALGYYDVGAMPFIALQADQRVSYCLHVPKSLKDRDRSACRLIVAVHGTGRTATAFADLAERTGSIVLAPLSPSALSSPASCRTSSD